MYDLVDKVKSALEAIPLAGERILVAISGGPDSVALFRALLLTGQEIGLQQIHLAHLNHQLRGHASDADEEFIRVMVEKLSHSSPLPLVLHVDCLAVREIAQRRKQGVESTARQLRYDWLKKLARSLNVAWVATGHTANDQAETILHHLVRGTGIKGLSGIPKRRPLAQGIEVIRPLLDIGKDEILQFLNTLDQPFQADESNSSPQYTRNRIRHDLLPLLQKDFNPGIIRSLLRLGDQAKQVQQILEGLAQQLLKNCELPRAGPLRIFQLEVLQSTSPHLQCEMFRLVWKEENWPEQNMGYFQWNRMREVIRGQHAAMDFPGQIRAKRVGTLLQVGPYQ